MSYNTLSHIYAELLYKFCHLQFIIMLFDMIKYYITNFFKIIFCVHSIQCRVMYFFQSTFGNNEPLVIISSSHYYINKNKDF